MELPKHYDPHTEEEELQKFWLDNNIYAFDPDSDKEVFSVDTPPPTVSGRMHIGHAFSYAQGDFIARFQRMRGKNVLYPWGTDDNGLPTERLVEKEKGIYALGMKASEFRKHALEYVEENTASFSADWVRIGMSANFKEPYSTINDHCRKTSQLSFIDLFKKGFIYKKKTPVSWCPRCQTAIAQAEFENVEKASHFNDIQFTDPNGKPLTIATTRPELIPACVAVAAHPDDERYKVFKGKEVTVPLFNYSVPVIFDKSVDPELGTGILMVCTFGDKEDIEKWHKHKLDLRSLFTRDGKLTDIGGKYAGLKIKEARKQIIADLDAAGLLLGQKEITHPVNVHERCGTDLEFLNTEQWFVDVMTHKKELLNIGKQINWFPDFMHKRYQHWVENLNWDWTISRQRPYGVPIPVWYDKDGEVVLPEPSELPVDPSEMQPASSKEKLTPETDVMDTWFTSSLSPQIVLNWAKDDPAFDKTFPMSVRLQAHDIIRTWAFYTIVKGVFSHDVQPWNDIVVSGHALDPKGKKMSKSKGNVVDPREVIEKFSADAMRFWAASTKLGEDLPYQEKDVHTGQKTVTKLWNASKFALMHLENYSGDTPKKLEVIDAWILTKFAAILKEATAAFDKYEYSRTKALIDNFFWNTFCDNYLELVKDRLYNEERTPEEKLSAQFTLYTVVLGQLKMFAPIMPHITEKIFQLYFAEKEDLSSIHISTWPSIEDKYVDLDAEKAGDVLVELLSQTRKHKSEQSLSLKADIASAQAGIPADTKRFVDKALADFKATARIQDITFVDSDAPSMSFS